MKLEMGSIKIKDVVLGDETYIQDNVLTVDKDGLIAYLKEDIRIKSVKVDLAKPGDKTRIIPVKDAIEPRVKVGEGAQFPGVINSMESVGAGTTHKLDGVAVITTGKIVGIQEGIIDMSGPGADYTPFSKTLNIVVDIDPADDINQHQHEEAIRKAGLRAAEYIGAAGREVQPDEVKVYENLSVPDTIAAYPDLPKVVYLKMLIAQGLLHDTYIYGSDSKTTLPTYIHPNEILDGALVSGNCVAACDKITTYQHQNNSVILDLYEKHGQELAFLGVVLTSETVTLAGKLRACNHATNLVKALGPDGVIISEEGYGNPDTDLMMNCQLLEKAGIKTVLITDECAGRDGKSQSLADTAPEAQAIVTTGNVSALVTLPPMEKVIGKEETIANLAGGYDGSLKEDGSISCELNAIIGSTSEIGYHKVTTALY